MALFIYGLQYIHDRAFALHFSIPRWPSWMAFKTHRCLSFGIITQALNGMRSLAVYKLSLIFQKSWSVFDTFIGVGALMGQLYSMKCLRHWNCGLSLVTDWRPLSQSCVIERSFTTVWTGNWIFVLSTSSLQSVWYVQDGYLQHADACIEHILCPHHVYFWGHSNMCYSWGDV